MTNIALLSLPERIHVTGLAVDPVDLQQLFGWVVAAAKQGRIDDVRRTVGYLNVHVANTAAKDAELQRYLNELCDLVYCDGKGIAWGARLQGLPEPPRMTAADWLPDLLRTLRDADLRTFVVAGKPGVVENAVDNLADLIDTVGPIAMHDGYLTNDEQTEEVLAQITAFDADVVLVGMGTPVQEHWTLRNRDQITAPIVWPLGATFDYFTDEQERGPEWLRRAGHEWAARLIADPVRLWRRYVLGNPQFLARAVLARRS